MSTFKQDVKYAIRTLALQRTTEIGVRMALGARAADVLGMIVGQSMRLTVAGVFLGITIALALTRLIANLLFDVSPHDPATYLTVAGVLAGTP